MPNHRLLRIWVGLWEANNNVGSQSESTHKRARKGKTDICVKDQRRMKKGISQDNQTWWE